MHAANLDWNWRSEKNLVGGKYLGRVLQSLITVAALVIFAFFSFFSFFSFMSILHTKKPLFS